MKCISIINPQTCYKFALSIALFYHTISILPTITYRNQQLIKRITYPMKVIGFDVVRSTGHLSLGKLSLHSETDQEDSPLKLEREGPEHVFIVCPFIMTISRTSGDTTCARKNEGTPDTRAQSK